MFTRTYNFRELKLFGERRGECVVCGKKVVRKKTFIMTASPFNKNEDGSVCSDKQIYEKLQNENDRWEKTPLVHAKCECGLKDL